MKQPLGTKLDENILKELRAYAAKTMIPMSRVIEAAIAEYLKKHTSK